MLWKVKKIIHQKGAQILKQPELFVAEMRGAGCSEQEIHTMMLVLSGCPAVVGVLVQEFPQRTQIHNLIRSITKNTGLSIGVARRVLGTLMLSCGKVTPDALTYYIWPAGLLDSKNLPKNGDLAEELVAEDDLVQKLSASLECENADASVFSSLQVMSGRGNAKATYCLGLFFLNHQEPEAPSKAEEYFVRAASLGYGPAHGAIAEIRSRDVRYVCSAMDQISHPVALCGAEGRRWRPVMDKLLKYQQANISRMGSLLGWQLLSVLVMLVLMQLLGMGVCTVSAVTLQIIGLLWVLWARYWKPLLSCAVPVYLLAVSWALVMLGIVMGGGMV